MTPPGGAKNLKHRIRRAHPLRLPMRRTLAALDHADATQIREFQEKRLRALVRVAAARAPFYREFFRSSGVDPRDIRTLDDLTLLPLISRTDLAERAEDFLVYPRKLMWSARSSGTSGAPIASYRTMGSSVYELSVLERQWSWFGLPADSKRVVLRGSDFAADQDGKPTQLLPGARQLMVSSFHLTPEHLGDVLDEIRRFQPDAIEGWPSSIALLAALLRERGEKVPVTAIITSSEVMTPGQIALMRDVFAGPIVDHYGQTERVTMAGTCEAGSFHIFPDYGIVELHPVGGSDTRWEIVGTALHNWGFPLFRYRTGDEVGPAAKGPCACGRSYELLGAIDGRVEDSFTAADGRPLPLPSTIIDDLDGLREAQIAQLAPGRFEVRVVPGDGYDADATMALARRNVDRMFGADQILTLKEFDRLQRPASGKLKSAIVENTVSAPTSGPVPE